MLVCGLHRLGRITHVLQNLCVGLSILQSLSLELDGRHSAVNLLQLFLKTPLSPQGHQGRCVEGGGEFSDGWMDGRMGSKVDIITLS